MQIALRGSRFDSDTVEDMELLELQLLVDQVMAANAANQVGEPTVLYCVIARCASCGKQHTAPTIGVMFDRCGCGGYLLELAGAWNPVVNNAAAHDPEASG